MKMGMGEGNIVIGLRELKTPKASIVESDS